MDSSYNNDDYNIYRRKDSAGPISGSRITAPLPEIHGYYSAPTTAVTTIQPHKPNKRGVSGFLLATVLIVGMLLGAVGAGGVLWATGAKFGQQAANNTPAPVAAAPTSAPTTAPAVANNGNTDKESEPVTQVQPNTITNIFKKVTPSVVQIISTISGNGQWGGGGQGTGTGIVLDKQGHVLTNNHVVDGATTIKVSTEDGNEYNAKVVGTAPQDDLAVIQVDMPADRLVPAELGDSSTLQTGDSVIAIGYPFGLDQSVSSGIVSGVNRDYASAGSRTMRGLIQTDAAINPGNSGGPLLNDQGQVIGINTLIESPIRAFTGIGFAIPINRAKELLPQLEKGGELQRPWIGISGTEITPSVKQQYNLSADKGIAVIEVIDGGPAAQAGLQPADVSQDGSSITVHDIVTAIDGHSVGSIAELTSYLDGKQPGDKVTLTVLRDGQEQQIEVTLQPWPKQTTQEQQQPDTPQLP